MIKLLVAVMVLVISLGAFLYALADHSSLFAYKIEHRSGEGVANKLGDLLNNKEEKDESDTRHIETPESVRAVYMTSCAAGTPSFRERFIEIVDTTEINSIVIDIKDYTGTLSFVPENKDLLGLWENSRCGAKDMEGFISKLHEKDVYVIGRITVFQDPYYVEKNPQWAVQKASDGSVWRDDKGLAFIDVGAREAWEHTVEIAKESYYIGFDELNFDYVRYPTDGNLQDIQFPHTGTASKANTLETFFKYLDETLEEEIPNVVTSVDIFGMTTTNFDDMSIGQVLEKTLPYFDYVSPMVYPSHYPTGFNGWSNPNEVPGPLIKYVMDSAVERAVADSSIIKTLDSEVIKCEVEENEESESAEGSTDTEEKPLPPECKKTLYTKESYEADKIRPWLQDFDYGGDYDAEDVRAQIEATYAAGLDSWMLWDPGNVYTLEALEQKSE
ncbi:MAG: putative glycoside hydrolase [Candidatus Campbellbacteria bacterium]|nr:putative glycoside hydrolase [Candidatus Campbellbacteria bacterium]